MCLCVRVGVSRVCGCPTRPGQGVGCLEAGVTSPDLLGSGNRTWVLRKSSKHSYPLRHLSSPTECYFDGRDRHSGHLGPTLSTQRDWLLAEVWGYLANISLQSFALGVIILENIQNIKLIF